MNKLVLIGLCLFGCAVVAEESISDNGDSEPFSAVRSCLWFPLTLFDWNGHSSDISTYTSDSDTGQSSDAASFIDGGAVSFIERLLLFPVCLLQEENCNKVFNSADDGDTGTVFQICRNNDDLSLLEYIIEAVQKAIKSTLMTIAETYTMYGWGNATVPSLYLQDIYHGTLHRLDHVSSNVLSTIQNLCSCVDTVQASIMKRLGEFTVPGFGISSTDIGISSTDFGLSSILTIVHQLFRETTWTAIRYIVVGIIAMSLFPSGRHLGRYAKKAMRSTKRLCGLPNEARGHEGRFQPSLCAIAEHSSENSLLAKLESVLDSVRPGELQRPSQVTEQMLKEHYPMCECFDYRNCNCDGKPFCKESTHRGAHFNMCEFFDLLPCNCGGTDMGSTYTNYDISMDTLHDERDLESNVCDNAKTVCTRRAAATTEQSVQASPDVISRDTSPESSFQTTSDIEGRVPHWVKLAVGHYHMLDSEVLSCRRKLNENHNEAKIADNNNTSNVSPFNLSHAATKVSPGPVDDSTIATGHSEKDSLKAGDFVSSEQFKKKSPSKKVQFVSDIRDELDEDECLAVHSDTSTDIDSVEDISNIYLDDSTTSNTGSPYINSSFKEESPYFTANAIASSDLRDRGDGAVYSTLTRRSPYVEEGLGDLSMDTSCRESEGSILDVSDINNSVSFTSGEGLLEVAALFALQTIWRLAKRVWHRKQTDTSCNDVAIEEKESGLYIIRQNNTSKGLRSPRHPQNKQSAENDGKMNTKDSNNTETILHYEIINTVRKREVTTTSTAEETNYQSNYCTFRDMTHSTRQQHQPCNKISPDHCRSLESFAEDNIQDGYTDSNNNARYSKRKRNASKRQSDSDDKADCEDCDCTNNVSRKRGRTVYKTSETFYQCHTNKPEESNFIERRRVNKIVTRSRSINAKRKHSKTRSARTMHTEKRQKVLRTRKDLSKPNRSQSSDFQISVDRLSRDLRNASVNDRNGEYAGDTSDEFADESSTSSDEISKLQNVSSKTEDKLATLQIPSGDQDKTTCGNASTSDDNGSRKRVKRQHKELNDIVCKLRSLRCDAWELKDYRYINKKDNTSKVLAWAWSCVEK